MNLTDRFDVMALYFSHHMLIALLLFSLYVSLWMNRQYDREFKVNQNVAEVPY